MATELYKNWMEFSTIIIMLFGMFVAVVAPSAIISYIIIFICGLFAGRLIYHIQSRAMLPYLMTIVGFVLGFLIGVYYGNRLVAFIFFLLGAFLGFMAYRNHLLKDANF